MFYCESCAEKKGWPFDWYLAASRGPCEVCKEVSLCADVHHSHLPPATQQPAGEQDKAGREA